MRIGEVISFIFERRTLPLQKGTRPSRRLQQKAGGACCGLNPSVSLRLLSIGADLGIGAWLLFN